MNSLKNARQKTSAYVSFVVLGIYLAPVLYACIQYFTPVPTSDMWDGYVQFYLSVLQGDYGAWWTQVNEHRILLPKLLFWFDLTFLHGSMVLLNVVNVGLFLTMFALLMRLIMVFRGYKWHEMRFVFALLLIGTLSLSWIQSENLTWAFQSQFFMVYLFALFSFYTYAKCARAEKHPRRLLFAATVFSGLLSAASMANGLLCFPMLFVMALLLKEKKSHLLIFLALTLLTFGLYFVGEVTIQENHSLLAELSSHPFLLIKHTALSLGGPFYYLSIVYGSKTMALGTAYITGGGILLIALLKTITTLRTKKAPPQQIALLIMLLFVLGSISLISLARMRFGLDHALTIRYMTPSLLLINLLYILHINRFEVALTKYPKRMWAGLIVFMLPFWYFQFYTTSFAKNAGQKTANQMVAALALELGIIDHKQISHVCPPEKIDYIAGKALQAAAKNITVFRRPNLQRASDILGKPLETIPLTPCVGQIAVKPIKGVTGYMKVVGFLFAAEGKKIPERMIITDNKQQAIGYGLTGFPLPEVAKKHGEETRASGFVGYMRAQKLEDHINLIGENPGCRLVIRLQR